MKQLLIILSFFLFSWLLYRQVPNDLSHFDIDSFGYQSVALNFYYTDHLLDPATSERAPVQPVGYPFFMGLMYKLFGPHVPAVICVQIILMAINILLLMVIAAQLFGQTAAYTTGILAVLNVGFLVYPQFLLAEAVLLFLFMLFFYCFVLFYVHRSRGVLYAGALVLGISTIVKPTALCFPIILIPAIILHLWSHKWQAVCIAMGFALIFLAPIVVYMTRNYIIYGYFSFAPMMPLNMYQCLLAKVISRVNGLPIQEVIDTQLRFTGSNTFDPAGWNAARTLFYEYLYRYPHIFIFVWAQNVLKTLFGLFSTQLKVLVEPAVQGGDCSFFAQGGSLFERIQSYITSGITQQWLVWIAYSEAFWSALRWLLVMIGLGSLLREKKYGLVCIFVLCIMLFSVVTGMDGCCRYRSTFEPLLILLSAYALLCLHSHKRKLRV